MESSRRESIDNTRLDAFVRTRRAIRSRNCYQHVSIHALARRATYRCSRSVDEPMVHHTLVLKTAIDATNCVEIAREGLQIPNPSIYSFHAYSNCTTSERDPQMNTITKRELDAATRVVAEIPVPLDRIPYTPAFEDAHHRLRGLLGLEVPANRAWHLFTSVRKRGLAPRRFRSRA